MLLYIDPGTGSMLVTVLIGIAGAAVYALRSRIMKMKTKIGGGKVKADARTVPYVSRRPGGRAGDLPKDRENLPN